MKKSIEFANGRRVSLEPGGGPYKGTSITRMFEDSLDIPPMCNRCNSFNCFRISKATDGPVTTMIARCVKCEDSIVMKVEIRS